VMTLRAVMTLIMREVRREAMKARLGSQAQPTGSASMASCNFVARYCSPRTALLQPTPEPQSLSCDAG
jgi:hypothetical protein